jgi:L-aspartate oxidase
MAAAWRAGAELRDMEFMQFHPTVLYVAGSSRFLISEAVRGEGAYLRDKNMDRFMLKVDPRAELAPRDVVAQAIVRQMDKTRHPNVYLDLRHLDPALVRRRFPGIAKVCHGFGLDITTDLIPIRPGAHYMVGGVTVDDHGRTTLPNLWAAGEVTSSGLHGANRLASNSLLEGLVVGERVARAVAGCRAGGWPPGRAAELQEGAPAATGSQEGHPAAIAAPTPAVPIAPRAVVQSAMSAAAAIGRDAAGLAAASDVVEGATVLGVPVDRAGVEDAALTLLAQAVLAAAGTRTESRGCHVRTDFPLRDDVWQRAFDCTEALHGKREPFLPVTQPSMDRIQLTVCFMRR